MAKFNFRMAGADASVSMLKSKSRTVSCLQGFVVFAGLALPSSWVFAGPAAETVSVPVQKGEDLMTALKRVHPCFDNPGVKIPTQVFNDNPEKVGRGGSMVLARPTLKVPASFLDSRQQCGPRAIAEIKTESLPEAKPETKPVEPPTAENHELYKFRRGPEVRPEHAEKQEAGEQNAEEEPGPHYKNHVTVLGLVDYSRLAATINGSGAMPILVSKPQPGFELVYSRELTPAWSVGFNYMYLNTTFQDLDGTPFTELTSSLHEFAFSARYRLSQTSRISLLIGGAQVDELSVNPVDSSLLIDHKFRVTGSFIFWQELGKIAGFEILGGLGAQTFIPTDWSQESVGVGELFRLLFERELGDRWSVEFGALGAYERQETQSESHSELSIAFGLGLSFRF